MSSRDSSHHHSSQSRHGHHGHRNHRQSDHSGFELGSVENINGHDHDHEQRRSRSSSSSNYETSHKAPDEHSDDRKRHDSDQRRRHHKHHRIVFLTPEERDKASTEKKLTFQERINEKVIQTLPSSTIVDVEDMRIFGFGAYLALIYNLLWAVSLSYFLIVGTRTGVAKKFLSLVDDGSAVCETIPVVVTGTFYADRSGGYWSSNSKFDRRNALYQLDLTATAVKPADFTAAMQNFSSQLYEVGMRQANDDVISSLLAWDLFRAVPNTEANMQLRTLAKLSDTLSGMSMAWTPALSSRMGVCNTGAFGIPSYSTSSMILTTPFPSRNRLVLDSCPDQINLGNKTLGLNFLSTTNSFDLDMRTVLTAFALNMGIIDTSALTAVSNRNLQYRSQAGLLQQDFVSESLGGMQKFSCFSMPGDGKRPRVCFSSDTNEKSLIYPVVTTSTPPVISGRGPYRSCSCETDAEDWWCNVGDNVELALVFSRTNNFADTLDMGWRLQQMIADDAINGKRRVKSAVSGLVYSADFLGYACTYLNGTYSMWRKGVDIPGYNLTSLNLDSYATFASAFKQLGNDMSMISYPLHFSGSSAGLNEESGVLLSSFGSVLVNDNSNGYSPVPQATCQNSIYQEAALNAMAATPPLPLLQPYFTCHATLLSALGTASGVAAGNSALITSTFLTAALTLIVFYYNQFSKDNKITPPARKADIALELNDREKKEMLRQMKEMRATIRGLVSLNKILLKHSNVPNHELQQQTLMLLHLPVDDSRRDTIPSQSSRASASSLVQPDAKTVNAMHLHRGSNRAMHGLPHAPPPAEGRK